MKKRTPKSPRESLPWVVDKMLEVLEKEGLHPVAPDVMAQHLGYTNAKNGRAATVLGTIRMYGLIEKGPNRKDVISEDVQRFKYTPSQDEKYNISRKWLSKPNIFSFFLERYPSELPSDKAFRYELISDHGFTEQTANNFIETFKESLEYTESFRPDSTIEDSEVEEDKPETLDKPNSELEKKPNKQQNNSSDFTVQILGPGMDSTIKVLDEDDIQIVKIMLSKIEKQLNKN